MIEWTQRRWCYLIRLIVSKRITSQFCDISPSISLLDVVWHFYLKFFKQITTPFSNIKRLFSTNFQQLFFYPLFLAHKKKRPKISVTTFGREMSKLKLFFLLLRTPLNICIFIDGVEMCFGLISTKTVWIWLITTFSQKTFSEKLSIVCQNMVEHCFGARWRWKWDWCARNY